MSVAATSDISNNSGLISCSTSIVVDECYLRRRRRRRCCLLTLCLMMFILDFCYE